MNIRIEEIQTLSVLSKVGVLPGYHRHVQAQEEGTAVGGLWSKQDFGSTLLAPSQDKVSNTPFGTLYILICHRTYVPLDSTLYKDLEEGKIRLWVQRPWSPWKSMETLKSLDSLESKSLESAVWPWRSCKTLFMDNQWPKRKNAKIQSASDKKRESNPR